MRYEGKIYRPPSEADIGSAAKSFGENVTKVFRTNHASNYLRLAGRLPQDRERIVEALDKALSGEIALRPEWSRGL